jgi:hypothetical protein
MYASTTTPLPVLSAASRATLREINESALTLLTEIAHDVTAEPDDFTLAYRARQLLRQTSPAERGQLARMPALLVDVEFRRADWWISAATHCNRARTRTANPISTRHLNQRRMLRSLARAALAYVWNVVQQDRPGAQIVLGTSTAVMDVIAGVGPQHMQRIADQALWHLRPRWHDCPSIWEHLLCQNAPPAAARAARIQWLQHLDASALQEAR